MSKLRRNNIQTAQAMVEFALVLPILLLLLFGIVAFGHLFFTYSLVVASSREAARFGAAVGLTSNNLPNYRDCDEIRNAAIRVGNLAGVQASSVTVQYDEGLRLDGTVVMHPDGCPAGGIGPGYIELGDRIVVTVRIDYDPIVPLINFDAIPLTAETRRTIIIGMPVGEVTPAVSLCTGTITRILPLAGETFEDIVVGEYFSAQLEVISDNPALPAQGSVSLYVDDPTYSVSVCSGAANMVINCSAAPIHWGTRFYDVNTPIVLRARYNPGSFATPAPPNPCFNPSQAEPVVIWLDPAPTTTTITSIEIVATDDGDVARVSVMVVPDPDNPTPPLLTGPVDVFDTYGNRCSFVLEGPYPANIAAGYCDLGLSVYGGNIITAIYNPAGNPAINPNYLSSFDEERYEYFTPTPSPTPTIITPIATPQGTPLNPTETIEPPELETVSPTNTPAGLETSVPSTPGLETVQPPTG